MGIIWFHIFCFYHVRGLKTMMIKKWTLNISYSFHSSIWTSKVRFMGFDEYSEMVLSIRLDRSFTVRPVFQFTSEHIQSKLNSHNSYCFHKFWKNIDKLFWCDLVTWNLVLSSRALQSYPLILISPILKHESYILTYVHVYMKDFNCIPNYFQIFLKIYINIKFLLKLGRLQHSVVA